MATENKNVLKVFDTPANLSSGLDAGMFAYDTTNDRVAVKRLADSVMLYISDDTQQCLLTGNQTVAGVKTFGSFPITPSSAPTTDYQVANKKYVDDSITAEDVWDRDSGNGYIYPNILTDTLGIGTATPNAGIEVALDISRAYTSGFDDDNNILVIRNSQSAATDDRYAGIQLRVNRSSGASGDAGIACILTGDGDSELAFLTQASGVFTEQVRITSDGVTITGSAISTLTLDATTGDDWEVRNSSGKFQVYNGTEFPIDLEDGAQHNFGTTTTPGKLKGSTFVDLDSGGYIELDADTYINLDAESGVGIKETSPDARLTVNVEGTLNLHQTFKSNSSHDAFTYDGSTIEADTIGFIREKQDGVGGLLIGGLADNSGLTIESGIWFAGVMSDSSVGPAFTFDGVLNSAGTPATLEGDIFKITNNSINMFRVSKETTEYVVRISDSTQTQIPKMIFQNVLADGVFFWNGISDYFEYEDHILIESSKKLYIGDTDHHISYTAPNGHGGLTLDGGDGIQIVNQTLDLGNASTTDAGIDFFGSSGTGSLTYESDNDQFVLNAGLTVGDATNYVEYESDGKVIYHGTAGVTHGEIYASNVGTTETITSSGKVNKVQITAFDNNGFSRNMTPEHINDHIICDEAGTYMATVTITAKGGTGSGFVAGFSLYKNNGATEFLNVQGERNITAGGTVAASVALNGIIDLQATDTVEVWVWNITNTTDIIIDYITLSLVQLGGT